MQISTLIGKPILSAGGQTYGYVTDVRFARGYEKISCFICADEEEEEFYLPLRSVIAMRDAVIAGKGRISAPTGIPSPIGKAVYTHTGEARGIVTDVELGEEIFPLLIIANGEETTSAPVPYAVVGEQIILYPDTASRAAATKGARTSTARKSEKKLKAEKDDRPALPDVNPIPPAEPTPVGPAQPEQPLQPMQPEDPIEPSPSPKQDIRLLNRNNLLGRHVRRSVYDKTGTPIAIAGERITPAILSAARRAGKLLELTVNTLTIYH